MSHKRSRAAEIARDTVAAVAAGRYTNPAGAVVDLHAAVEAAKTGTVEYPPGESIPRAVPPARPTRFEVSNETTLAVARRLAADGHRVAALNFASARNPGGGFLNGARAQEESLCRASALYECLRDCRMYPHHAPMPGGMYTNYAVYSPDVPVFKDDDGAPLPAPYSCSFVTAPAVNAGVIRPDERERVRGEMAARVKKVLGVMTAHEHDAVVLGAWGCGVFKNDPDVIADLFREALATDFAGVFAVAAFAVLDTSVNGGTYRAFAARFAG